MANMKRLRTPATPQNPDGLKWPGDHPEMHAEAARKGWAKRRGFAREEVRRPRAPIEERRPPVAKRAASPKQPAGLPTDPQKLHTYLRGLRGAQLDNLLGPLLAQLSPPPDKAVTVADSARKLFARGELSDNGKRSLIEFYTVGRGRAKLPGASGATGAAGGQGTMSGKIPDFVNPLGSAPPADRLASMRASMAQMQRDAGIPEEIDHSRGVRPGQLAPNPENVLNMREGVARQRMASDIDYEREQGRQMLKDVQKARRVLQRQAQPVSAEKALPAKLPPLEDRTESERDRMARLKAKVLERMEPPPPPEAHAPPSQGAPMFADEYEAVARHLSPDIRQEWERLLAEEEAGYQSFDFQRRLAATGKLNRFLKAHKKEFNAALKLKREGK